MLEKFIYKNHMNEELNFGHGGIYVNSNELHDFSWEYTSTNNRISLFQKGIVEKTIPVVIMADSEEEGIRIRNNLFEVAEKDVLAMKYGQIIIGDYHLKCYVTESKKSNYLLGKNIMNVDLRIVTDIPSWIKETTTTFGYSEGTEGKNLDFNNDFPYDYSNSLVRHQVNNTNFVKSNFKLTIYGACENPSIAIAGHEYEVDVELEANEYLTIDSIEKTIILTHADGTTENCFNLRNRNSYIFEKIPVGVNSVTSGQFKFDVTLLEERGEPKWT